MRRPFDGSVETASIVELAALRIPEPAGPVRDVRWEQALGRMTAREAAASCVVLESVVVGFLKEPRRFPGRRFPNRSGPLKQKAEVDILHTLALVFVRASEARGVPLPAGFHEQLIIYGTRSSRMRLITEIDEMKDLAPYVSSRCPEITATVPGFGTVEMGPCYSVPPLHILACLVYRTSKQSEHGGVAERWTAPVPPFWSWCYG